MSCSPRTLQTCCLQAEIAGGNFWVRHDRYYFSYCILTSYAAAEACQGKPAPEKRRKVRLVLGPNPRELQEDVDIAEEQEEVDELLHDDWVPVSNFLSFSFGFSLFSLAYRVKEAKGRFTVRAWRFEAPC
jgi:hypothetical protein